MGENLINRQKIIKVKDTEVSAGTEVVSDEVDTKGYDGVMFFTTFSDFHSGNYIKGQQDIVTGMGSAADLADSGVVADEDLGVISLDIFQPKERFVRASVIRAGKNTVVGDIYAMLYRGNKEPENNGQLAAARTGYVGKFLQSPDEGAAV